MNYHPLRDVGSSSADVFQVFMRPRESFIVTPDCVLKLTSVPSTDATSQTDGFPFGLMLAFDDPAVADRAYEEFQEDGTTPDHGRGPWVVFIGRTPGVFTS